MKRQKCDRRTPCSRCIQNKEAHQCTTEWKDGYDPAVHRKYPRKSGASRLSQTPTGDTIAVQQLPEVSSQAWGASSNSSPGLPLPLRSQETGMPTPSETHDQSKLPNPSSTNIDFITYGRSDVTDISMGRLLQEKEADERNQALLSRNLDQSRTTNSIEDAPTKSFSPAAKAIEVSHLQSLLPQKYQVMLLVDYHQRCMNYWTGGL